MLIGIICVVALFCFYVSSWPFRLFYVAVPVGVFGLWADVKMFRSSFAMAEQAYFTSMPGFQLLATLPSVYGSVVLLGTVLGLMRTLSSSAETYRARRLRFFKFIGRLAAVWVLPYFALLTLLRAAIDHHAGEADAGWLLTKAFGTYLLVAYIVGILVARSLWKKARTRRPEPEPAQTSDRA